MDPYERFVIYFGGALNGFFVAVLIAALGVDIAQTHTEPYHLVVTSALVTTLFFLDLYMVVKDPFET